MDIQIKSKKLTLFLPQIEIMDLLQKILKFASSFLGEEGGAGGGGGG